MLRAILREHRFRFIAESSAHAAVAVPPHWGIDSLGPWVALRTHSLVTAYAPRLGALGARHKHRARRAVQNVELATTLHMPS